MASGVQQQIGIGKAQILPRGESNLDFVRGLNQQNNEYIRYNDYKDRLAQEKKEKDDRDLYAIIGNALNPKNFNTLIHDKLRLATAELAAKIKRGGQSYGDVYMDALGKAGELGTVSDKLNRIDQILAATRGEYEKYDKRLNTPAIEYQARKKIIDQLKAGQPVDENYNYFDDALGSMGAEALTDKTDALMIDLTPEEAAQSKLTGKYTEQKLNRKKRFDWNVSAFPGFYDVNQKDELQDPTLTAKGVATGLNQPGMEKMLSDEAYRRMIITPSNLTALNERIKKHGVPLNSKEADVLRRIEAYNYLEGTKPRVNKQEEARTTYPPAYVVNVNSGSNTDASNLNNIYERIKRKGLQRAQDYASGNYTDNSLGKSDLDGEELEAVIKATQNKDLTPDDVKVIVEADGKTGVYNKGTGERLVYLNQTGVNLPEQANTKGKQASVQIGNQEQKPTTIEKPSNKPKVKINW